VHELLETYDAWRAEGLGVGRAVVIRTFGSAPRTEGAVLLVAEDGRMIGSVSGGCVEGAAARAVLESRETGRSRVIRYGISDEEAWDVGLACGGTIDVLVEPEVRGPVIEAARELDRTAVTPLPSELPPAEVGAWRASGGDPPGEPVVVADGATDRLPEAVVRAAHAARDTGRSGMALAAGRGWFLEAYPRRPRLVAIGATEVTRQLAGFARALDYEVVVVDARPAFATPERFPDVDSLLVLWPDEAFDQLGLGPNDAVAVLSHDPKFDEPAIVEAVRRGARYVGAVGSRKSQASRRERLLAAGLTPDELARVHGPIGLDLGGRDPAETALAIMAEIVAARRGGTGAPLRDGAGRITKPDARPAG
jgi:xanthine dehydrogenase accessory factor